MSMISGLIDELRKSADEWNGSNMFELARMCSDAADTIWELRCRLVDAEDRVRKSGELCKLCEREAENAKLRVERDEWHRVAVSKQDIIDHMRNANSENAKLRESLENAAGIITDICGECPVSRYEWLSSDGCAEKCGTVTEEECWIAYLTGKRWDESRVEVDG